MQDRVRGHHLGVEARALIYLVKPVNGRLGYSFTLLTAERAGGAFQVSIQATGTILN
jgi:hypothetical protein